MKIIAVGKIKKSHLLEGINFYTKQISKIEIIEVKQSNIFEEGINLLSKIKSKDYVITLDIQGNEYSSEKFSEKIAELKSSGREIVFVIGGSNGLSEEVKKRSDEAISFSKLTFPHELFRLILVEQIFRAEAIELNKPYHK